MGIEIRSAVPDEFTAAIDVISTAFLERPDMARLATSVAETWDPARTWVAWDGDRACGTFRSIGTQLTVPGGASLPASAVSAVTVRPTHRRRGILTAMAAREHGALVERGEAVGLLYASEYRIYGRFGYAPATHVTDWVLAPRDTGMHGTASGSVELVTVDEDAATLLKGLFEAWRPRRAGEITRTDAGWGVRLGLREDGWGERWKGWVLVHRDEAGTPDGYARYKADPKWEHHTAVGEINVGELIALTAGAYADLVRFFVDMDLVAKVKLEARGER